MKNKTENTFSPTLPEKLLRIKDFKKSFFVSKILDGNKTENTFSPTLPEKLF